MVWPADDLTKAALDTTTDDPSQARAELEALVDKVKLMLAEAVALRDEANTFTDINTFDANVIFNGQTSEILTESRLLGYIISNGHYTFKRLSVVAQDTIPTSVRFNQDGTKMYILGASNDSVFQYTLSTAWDVSTAVYENKSFSFALQASSTYGIVFSSNGVEIFILNLSSDTVYQYTLATPWDVSTASYANKFIDISSQELTPLGIDFSLNGTKMYIIGLSADTVFQYTLTTAWDVSTASYANKSFSVSSQDTNPYGVSFSFDGTKMYILGASNDSVFQYTLSTAWDVSTASYSDKSFSTVNEGNTPQEIIFCNNGFNMYIVDSGTRSISQYSTNVIMQ